VFRHCVLLDLQRAVGDVHVLSGSHTRLLHGKNTIQILPADRNKGALRLRRATEICGSARQCSAREEAVGFLHGGDLAQPQLLRQRPCQVAKFRSLRPRACGEYAGMHSMLRSRMARPPASVAGGLTISPSFGVARNGCRDRYYRRRKYRAARPPRAARPARGRRFLLTQLRIVDLAAGIIENHSKSWPLLAAQPAVRAGVDVQQHADHWPALALTAMRTRLSRPAHAAGTCSMRLIQV